LPSGIIFPLAVVSFLNTEILPHFASKLHRRQYDYFSGKRLHWKTSAANAITQSLNYSAIGSRSTQCSGS
jgi:hypothetical protein